jgi:hypothetical protein
MPNDVPTISIKVRVYNETKTVVGFIAGLLQVNFLVIFIPSSSSKIVRQMPHYPTQE